VTGLWSDRVSWRFERLQFEMFRAYWRLRFGRQRWQPTEVGRLRVLCDDVRAYWIARGNGRQDVMGLWERLVAHGPELCIDIGANYGEFAASAAAGGAAVWAIEANPRLVGCLVETFSANARVKVIEGAMSDTDGQVVLYSHPQCAGYGSLFAPAVGRNRFMWRQSTRSLSWAVPGYRLETLMDRAGVHPRSMVLKIDVEGAEAAVLNGAARPLAACEWWRAIVEWSPFAIAAAGAGIASTWREYRAFPGVVVDGSTGIAGVTGELRALPATPPADKCDLVIGAGVVPRT
jgi:FkbM family methyltransferase